MLKSNKKPKIKFMLQTNLANLTAQYQQAYLLYCYKIMQQLQAYAWLGEQNKVKKVAKKQPQSEPKASTLSKKRTPGLKIFKHKLNQEKLVANSLMHQGKVEPSTIVAMEVIKGRMYDYNNGRFLSVDPFIQSPTNTQSLNPYTYIFNNPLSGIDPTGYLIVWDRNECEKTKSSGACSFEVGQLLGKKEGNSGKKESNGKSKSIEISDVSDIDVNDSCKSFDCDLFRQAKSNGGRLTLVIDQLGNVQYIDIQRKERFFNGVVVPVAADLYKDWGPGGGAIDCNERGDCNNFEKGLAAVDFIPGIGKVIGVVGGVVLVPLIKNINKTDEAVDLFRVVDDVELADIKNTGIFRSPAGTLEEGKQFVDNLSDARALQGKFSKFFGGNQTIVKGTAPQSVIKRSTKLPFSDIPNGTAITVPIQDLPKVKPSL